MEELTLIDTLAWAMILSGFILDIYLYAGREVPYGRYWEAKKPLENIKVNINANVAWFFQELPMFIIVSYFVFFSNGKQLQNLPNQLLMTGVLVHYFQRTFVFSMLIRGGKPTPLITFISAVVFCSYNGYLQGRYFTQYAEFPDGWTSTSCFQIGALMFVAGMIINIQADHILRNLRKPGETGYKIPQGGMFEYVSGANFFGEMLEWVGYAIASWSLPAVAFAVFTCCNIGPRAVAHHKWYLEKFGQKYPRSRKAVIPFLL